MSTADPFAPWAPLAPEEVASLFTGVEAPWWIAGGHAIALAVGRRFREHADTDVLLLRRDQHKVQEVLPDWEWWAADPPGTLRPWRAGETLPEGVHDVWCRPGPAAPWRLQFMLDEADGDRWTYRRDARITLPLSQLGRRSVEGLPYLTPEVQLLCKAKGRRPKDERDLTETLPVLDAAQRRWLVRALSQVHGIHHPWLPRLGREDR
ncbi:nucleotidyltransferase domain-containing protein [Nocardiopsis sp. B62]|uniref:nucleotidyltransferase domain-containing protein n=1 Tax=Nocardiopsis sp. B62 TaxID=2824874 RepID=UPI001B3858EB|nr:amino acid transporter [Nocardiopsis sp. B62]MBQ1079889.1 amino acid transporter [Nocardiopsis sp. B62]